MKKIAIVTGASQGIGEGIAKRLARDYEVILLARNEDKLKAVQEAIVDDNGKARFFKCDVSNTASINEVLDKILVDFENRIEVIVNNAGIGGPFHTTDLVSESEWDKVFNTNVKSAFLFCKKLLPIMKANGGGRVVNISSILGILGGTQSSTYAASKHALVGYTKSIAQEWATFNITCNVISPGFIQTKMGAEKQSEFRTKIIETIPNKRQGTTSEIAHLVSFLCQVESAYINGADLIIDGGFTSGLRLRNL